MKPTLLLLLAAALRCASAPQTFFTGGGCAVIPGVGSPVLMIANAHRYIEDALNINNQHTIVKYVYFVKESLSNSPNVNTFRLVFSITDYNSTKFVGVEISQSPFGIGSVKIERFLLAMDMLAVRRFIAPRLTDAATFSCGDLKYVYSSFGNSLAPALDYAYPGNNNNTAGLNVLNSLSSGGGKPTASRTCVTANYLETAGFFGAASSAAPIDVLSCLPNKNAVASLNVGCNNNVLASIQVVFNNFGDNGTFSSSIIGNGNIPAAAVTNISLMAAEKVSFTSYQSPDSIKIATIDKDNNPVMSYTCGTGTSNPTTVVVNTSDFLGITDIFTNGVTIQMFDVTQYKAN